MEQNTSIRFFRESHKPRMAEIICECGFSCTVRSAFAWPTLSQHSALANCKFAANFLQGADEVIAFIRSLDTGTASVKPLEGSI